MGQIPLCTLGVPQLVKKFPTFYRTGRFSTDFTRARHWTSWARWVQSTPRFIIHSRLLLSLSYGFFPWVLELTFSHLLHMCCMSCPSHFCWLDHPLMWGVHMKTFTIIQYSPSSCHFFSFRSRRSPQHLVLKHNLCSSSLDQVLQPYKIERKIIGLFLYTRREYKTLWTKW